MHNITTGVYSVEERKVISWSSLPNVFLSPIRIDIVKFVHSNMAKNKRQPYSVNHGAGMNTSAISWGTGRAVARVPRVKGSGTNRSGQGAVANFCRGGRMFSPTTVWRKWHHKIIKNQRKYAITTAIACSGLMSIVMARGHKIIKTPEIPLVVESCIESLISTKFGQKTLEVLGANDDVIIKKKKQNIKAGKGKLRNRRKKKYLGPLVIFENNARCFRNISSVDTCSVHFLNLQKLAPGGHVGRFCIWTYKAFRRLDQIFKLEEFDSRKGEQTFIPTNIMTVSNLKTIINSREIQQKLRAPATILKGLS